MILADSSVVIELQRKSSTRVRQIAEVHDAAVIGVTRAELLSGARNPKEQRVVLAVLDIFRGLALDERVWDRTGDISARLRMRGRPLPITDTLIAAAAIHNAIPLWTRDRDFLTIQTVAPELVIFDEGTA